MRARDVQPRRELHVAPRGSVAHLYADCVKLAGSSSSVPARLLDGDVEVCGRCAEKFDGRGGGPSRTFSELLGSDPEDFGLGL